MRNDGNQVFDGRSDSLAQLEQPLAFPWRDGDAFGQLATEDFILSFEILYIPSQLPTAHAGQHYDQGVEEPGQGAILSVKSCSFRGRHIN